MDVTMLPGLIVGILVAGAVLVGVAPLSARSLARLAVGFAVLAGAASAALAAAALTGGTVMVTWLAALPLGGLPAALTLRVDALSAIFLLLLAVVPVAVALFGVGYVAGRSTSDVRRFFSPLLMLVAGMVLVVTASDWVFFLFAWEVMTLSSYFLVIWEWGTERHTRAAWVYLVTTHVTSSGILAAMCSLSLIAGSFDFAATSAALAGLFQTLPAFGYLVAGLFALGFLAKAAVYPLNFWLPEAYRAAPAPASGLFSGLMAKMGIYGLIRVFVFMVPAGGQPALVFGLVLATLGAASMLVGNLRSLHEQDAKRLVAQSSVGQIGYVVLGLGMAVALSGRAPDLAAVAFVGMLFHLVNHAFFKSLLFLTVGAIQRRIGTFDLRRMGGLLPTMPGVAALTLLGALAIAGTPPLNGFASKWLIYRAAFFGGLQLPILALFGVLAIFISTVSLAAYLKYFGSAFLGPESEDAARAAAAGPEPGSMVVAQWLLAGVCVVLGLWPQPVVSGALAALGGAPNASLFGAGQVAAADVMGGLLGGAGYQPVAVLLGLAVGGLVVLAVWRLGTPEVRSVRPWLGGEEHSVLATRYGSAHLYQSFLSHWASLLTPAKTPRLVPPPALNLALDADRWLFIPILRGYEWCCRAAGNWHRGQFRRYLIWQLLAVAAVVAIVLTFGGTEGRLPW
ncbi:MAG TPA: proton-conducting transporter membrane subunit [Symbiobacteriaceae bacterium]|jgi:hydrogenase-4 component B